MLNNFNTTDTDLLPYIGNIDVKQIGLPINGIGL